MTVPAAPAERLRIVILGLSVTSSWGNGHATTYRGLVRALCRRGHDVLFLERDMPWYREHRDMPEPPVGETCLYDSISELRERWSGALRRADLVIVGSYVPEGVPVIDLVQRVAGGLVAFYDIDTPVTLAAVAEQKCAYLDPGQIAGFDLYLSFTGGPVLRKIEHHYGAAAARPLYCAVDPELHKPRAVKPVWDLGYLGTYSFDRQPTIHKLLCAPAQGWPEGRFTVAGPLYPPELTWPTNVERIDHVGPDEHSMFYARQRFTLNVTRTDMVRWGYSPSVRLFEAAATGVPIISDWWAGLDELFEPGREILIARSAEDVLGYLRQMPESQRLAIADAARARVLAHHTAAHRAAVLESYVTEIRDVREHPRLVAAS